MCVTTMTVKAAVKVRTSAVVIPTGCDSTELAATVFQLCCGDDAVLLLLRVERHVSSSLGEDGRSPAEPGGGQFSQP